MFAKGKFANRHCVDPSDRFYVCPTTLEIEHNPDYFSNSLFVCFFFPFLRTNIKPIKKFRRAKCLVGLTLKTLKSLRLT